VRGDLVPCLAGRLLDHRTPQIGRHFAGQEFEGAARFDGALVRRLEKVDREEWNLIPRAPAAPVLGPPMSHDGGDPCAERAAAWIEGVEVVESDEKHLLHEVGGLILRGAETSNVAVGPWK